MKLSDIFETVSAGVTSVSSIGQVEYSAFSNRVKLYRKDCNNNHQCIAVIKRNKNDGWRFKPTKNWNSQKLDHFGHLTNIKSDKKGMKTISNNLESMLKAWGIKYDGIVKRESA
jgi:hypothetical protein